MLLYRQLSTLNTRPFLTRSFLLLNQLEQLEAILRKFKYWQAQSPDLSQITTPFGVNQISLYQWLQFIYLPRMKQLIDVGQPVPASEILPYAEQVIGKEPGSLEILHCIKKLDVLSSGCNTNE